MNALLLHSGEITAKVTKDGNPCRSSENTQKSFGAVSSCEDRTRLDYWTQLSTTPSPSLREGTFTVTHPFHPMSGQQFEILNYRHNWGDYRVTFYETPDRVRSLPAAWTSLATPDPSVVQAHGRAAFRIADLLALTQLLQRLEQEQKEEAKC